MAPTACMSASDNASAALRPAAEPAPARSVVASAFLWILALGLPSRCVGDNYNGAWHKARGTRYGGYDDGWNINEGSCGYGKEWVGGPQHSAFVDPHPHTLVPSWHYWDPYSSTWTHITAPSLHRPISAHVLRNLSMPLASPSSSPAPGYPPLLLLLSAPRRPGP